MIDFSILSDRTVSVMAVLSAMAIAGATMNVYAYIRAKKEERRIKRIKRKRAIRTRIAEKHMKEIANTYYRLQIANEFCKSEPLRKACGLFSDESAQQLLK